MTASADEAITAAWAEFRDTVNHARQALDRVRSTPTTTPEERRELQAQALSGALGRDMEQLARHVESGATSWPEVFEGTSPYSDLLRGHLERMIDVHAESVRQRIEDDPTFDPRAPHDDV